eukprot:TRINITY_DN3893_c0_g1_i1.p1 TRINITY_DN3893_c0_g1~~TRINITY_DN3893_c0_g1_i1.p1  ORF type:complete len:140 (+),score=21.24 TRINITY_DN3893_c0_g1_i1:59-421(+)
MSLSTKTIALLPLGAWLLWDTSSYWLPESTWIPVVSHFRRTWKANPQKQASHFKLAINIILFVSMVYQLLNDREDANCIRSPAANERKDLERGMEQSMMADLQAHSQCMDTLLVKHKIVM